MVNFSLLLGVYKSPRCVGISLARKCLRYNWTIYQMNIKLNYIIVEVRLANIPPTKRRGDNKKITKTDETKSNTKINERWMNKRNHWDKSRSLKREIWNENENSKSFTDEQKIKRDLEQQQQNRTYNRKPIGIKCGWYGFFFSFVNEHDQEINILCCNVVAHERPTRVKWIVCAFVVCKCARALDYR